jgi:hypothetical protein
MKKFSIATTKTTTTQQIVSSRHLINCILNKENNFVGRSGNLSKCSN